MDDNPLNLIIAEFLVSQHGYKVKTALSGQIAIDLVLATDYSNQPIILILMDLQMPGMDGYEATRNLKKLIPYGQDKSILISSEFQLLNLF